MGANQNKVNEAISLITNGSKPNKNASLSDFLSTLPILGGYPNKPTQQEQLGFVEPPLPSSTHDSGIAGILRQKQDAEQTQLNQINQILGSLDQPVAGDPNFIPSKGALNYSSPIPVPPDFTAEKGALNYSSLIPQNQTTQQSPTGGSGGGGVSIPQPPVVANSIGQIIPPDLAQFEGEFDIADLLANYQETISGIGQDPNREQNLQDRAGQIAGLEYDPQIEAANRAMEEIQRQLGIGRESLSTFGERGDETLQGIGNDLIEALGLTGQQLSGLFEAGNQDVATLSNNAQNITNAMLSGAAGEAQQSLEGLGLGSAVSEGLAPAQAAQGQAQARIKHEEATALREFSQLNTAFQSHVINDTAIAEKQFAGKRAEFASQVASSLGSLETTAMEAIRQGNFELGQLVKQRANMVSVLYQDLIEKADEKDRQLRQDALSELLAMVDLESQTLSNQLAIHNSQNNVSQQNFENQFSVQQYEDQKAQQAYENQLSQAKLALAAKGGGGGGGGGGSTGSLPPEAMAAFQEAVMTGNYELAAQISTAYGLDSGSLLDNLLGQDNSITGNNKLDNFLTTAGDTAGVVTDLLIKAQNDPAVFDGGKTPEQLVLEQLPTSDLGISPHLQSLLNNPDYANHTDKLNLLQERQNMQNAGKLSQAELAILALMQK